MLLGVTTRNTILLHLRESSNFSCSIVIKNGIRSGRESLSDSCACNHWSHLILLNIINLKFSRSNNSDFLPMQSGAFMSWTESWPPVIDIHLLFLHVYLGFWNVLKPGALGLKKNPGLHLKERKNPNFIATPFFGFAILKQLEPINKNKKM